MSARDRIVNALNALDGVKGYDHEPDQKHAGAAWPVLRELNPTELSSLCGATYTRTYEVFLVLNGSYAGASAAEAETRIEQLVEALEPLGEWLPPALTVQIAFDNQATAPGISVRVAPDPEE